MSVRQYDSNLGRVITLAALQALGAEGITVADHLKLDLELREIFSRITYGDPSVASQAGNFDANFVPIVTPAVGLIEFLVPHNLGRIPLAWFPMVPAKAGFGFAILENTRDADATNLYLKSMTTNQKLTVIVW